MRVSTATQTSSVPETVSQTTPNEQKNVDNKTSTAFQPQTLSEKIEKSWEEIPFLMKLEKQKQEEFSQIIAYEIQDLLKNGQVSTQVHYDKKMIYNFTSEKSATSPFTFYISLKPQKDKAVVSVNENKKTGLIGKGSRKEVYSGIKIHIPLEAKEEGKQIKIVGCAISHPLDATQFDDDLDDSLKAHKELYNIMKKQGLPGRLTKPPKMREHIQKSTGKKKQELIQPLYFTDMHKLIRKNFFISEKGKEKFIPIHERLDLIVEFLDSIASIHDLGWVHRDVKPENILVNRDEDGLHSYLHDFDLSCNEPVSHEFLSESGYCFWDELGDWLVSISSDFVGCMLTTIDVLYHNVDYNDVCHEDYKDGVDKAFYSTMMWKVNEFIKGNFSPTPPASDHERLINSLADSTPEKIIEFLDNLSKKEKYSSPLQYQIKQLKIEAELCLKLMKLFCSYFEKESSWKNEMIGSAIVYYIHLGASLKEDGVFTEKDLFLTGVDYDFKEKIIQNLPFSLSKIGYSDDHCRTLDLDSIFEKLLIYYKPEEGSSTKSIHDLSEESLIRLAEKNKFQRLERQKQNIESFLDFTQDEMPNDGNPRLFSLLNSKKLEDRQEGRQLEYEKFGRISDLSQKIREFAKEFKEDSAKIEKEFQRTVPVEVFPE